MAIKMVTPVRLEDRLSGLQLPVPPELADDVKSSLDIPIFDSNPSSSSRPVRGKLARCNSQGGLLERSEKGFDNVVGHEEAISFGPDATTIDFGISIRRISIMADITFGSGDLFLTDSTYQKMWFTLTDEVWYSFHWNSQYLHMKIGEGISFSTWYYNLFYY